MRIQLENAVDLKDVVIRDFEAVPRVGDKIFITVYGALRTGEVVRIRHHCDCNPAAIVAVVRYDSL